MTKIQLWSEWIYRLSLLNILWCVVAAAGLFVFGAAPAAAAVLRITRSWQQGDELDGPIPLVFFRECKRWFFKANALFWICLGAGVLLYWNISFFLQWDTSASPAVLGLSAAAVLLYTTLLLYSFPLYLVEERGLFASIACAFIYGVSFPLDTLALLLSAGILFWLSTLTPVIHLFFTVSVMAFLTVAVVSKNARKVQFGPAPAQQEKQAG
ncbi:YesL family protein [Alkalicoccus chagannorensis]|uniref:YesL family protein n=1 Tax=Alkalicoccus chagannorensis TaxID=427072 RepID=UPI000422FDA4|nr:DUF624 domain-containing protein [Alkalicoccus chagannorensis]